MQLQIIDTDDGPVIQLPEELLAVSKFKVGDTVNVYARNGKLVIAAPSEPYYTTAELLAGITDENIHPEIDWGPPVGKELW